MSYYERSLSTAAYAFDFVSSDSEEYYDNNYQYDGSEYPSYISSYSSDLTAANVFMTQKDLEVLKAVSFDTATTSESYTVKIYKKLADGLDPESGTLVDTVTGNTTYEGMYTVPLSKEIYLEKGDTYSVVVTLSKSSGKPVIVSECTASIRNWLACTASSKSGQSFIRYDDGSDWKDYGADGNGNIRIKAYTNTVKETAKVAVTGVKVSAGKNTIGVGNTTKVTATISPSNATVQDVTWSASDEKTATVTQNGVVTGVAAGTATITATTTDGGYQSSVKITVTKQKIYTIAFYGNNATSGSMSKMKKLKYATTYSLTQNAFKRKGYTFAGWNTKANGSGTSYKDGQSISKLTATDGATVKLYAQWKKASYRIIYKLNGGKNNSKNPVKYNITTKTIKLVNPTKKGYTFAGWYSDKSCKKKVTQIKKGTTGNKTLYAKWTPNKYKVQFVGNGADGGKMSGQTKLKYGKSYKLQKNTFKRSGYKFVGWSTKANGKGKIYKNADSIKNLTSKNGATVKLYAQWKKK